LLHKCIMLRDNLVAIVTKHISVFAPKPHVLSVP
jgi:hypothetical protein